MISSEYFCFTRGEPALPLQLRILKSQYQQSVLIVQRRMTHYRMTFFERLRFELAQQGCELRLAHGHATTQESDKNDDGHLGWAMPLQTRYFWDDRICWQPFGGALNGADLVVVTHENKLIYNLLAQFLNRPYRLGLWGHGANLQGNPTSLREQFKRVTARKADWWFAYTGMSIPLLEQAGYPRERITTLNNAVDTTEMLTWRSAIDEDSLGEFRRNLGIQGGQVGIFVGSLYTEKRVEFMLDAAMAVRRELPAFELLVVGSGPQQDIVKRFCISNPWAKYLGVLKGRAKVDALVLAKVMINPGAVGLGILDAFACGVPILTTDVSMHGPEIAYLESGVNGVMTANTLNAFVSATVALLTDEPFLTRLKAGCKSSATKYTVENMARNFADGVIACLSAPRYSGRPSA